MVEYYSYLPKDIKIGNPGKIKILVAVKKTEPRQAAERPLENLPGSGFETNNSGSRFTAEAYRTFSETNYIEDNLLCTAKVTFKN